MTKKALVKKNKCISCGTCTSICPSGAIIIGEDGKAEINKKKCKGCGSCKENCPTNAIELN